MPGTSDAVPKQMTRFIAIHTFEAQQDEDLALEKGQLVLGNFLEDDWWVGNDPASGKAGVFPNNFVAIEGSEAADKCLRKLAKKDPENKHVLAAKQSESRMVEGLSENDKHLIEAAESRHELHSSSVNPKVGGGDGGDDLDDVQVDVDLGADFVDGKDEDDKKSEEGGDTESAGEMSSQEAASKAAGQTITTMTVETQSVWRNWQTKIYLAAAKCVFALLSFSCLAGGQFHNINFISNRTGVPQVESGAGSGAVWYIVTAVQFSIAWCILMWMFEFVLTVGFIMRLKGMLPDPLMVVTDKMPKAFLALDLASLFMLSVAGFNMGATATLPPGMIKLLLQTNFTEAANPTVVNCSSTEGYDANSTTVTVPSQLDITASGGNIENLDISKLTIPSEIEKERDGIWSDIFFFPFIFFFSSFLKKIIKKNRQHASRCGDDVIFDLAHHFICCTRLRLGLARCSWQRHQRTFYHSRRIRRKGRI